MLELPPPVAAAPGSIALILPGQQTVFARAAEAVRLGFFAAHDAARSDLPIQVLEIDDDPAQLEAVIGGAADRGIGLVVGPLLRSGVNVVADGGYVAVPLVALNYPDHAGAGPATMIALGLSAEAEAQYVVHVALSAFVAPRTAPSSVSRFIVLSGAAPLERRIAQAYVSAIRAEGEVPVVIEVSEENAGRLAKLIDPGRHQAVFLALDAGAAALIRARIARPIPIFGTSLLNPVGLASGPEATALAHDLDGVRFVDMPWLLRGDAAAADAPSPPAALPAELARLYALGVDAYRVARRWAAGEPRFTLAGMTGVLRVDRVLGPRVERTPAGAIFRNGTIEREEAFR